MPRTASQTSASSWAASVLIFAARSGSAVSSPSRSVKQAAAFTVSAVYRAMRAESVATVSSLPTVSSNSHPQSSTQQPQPPRHLRISSKTLSTACCRQWRCSCVTRQRICSRTLPSVAAASSRSVFAASRAFVYWVRALLNFSWNSRSWGRCSWVTSARRWMPAATQASSSIAPGSQPPPVLVPAGWWCGVLLMVGSPG